MPYVTKIPVRLLFLAIALFSFLLSGQNANAFGLTPAEERRVEITLGADKKTVSPGDMVTISVTKNIIEGWHTYWINPGDSGESLKASWSGLDGIKLSEFSWPTPSKIPYPPLMNYGYEGEVTLLQTLTFPDSLPQAPITLNADISLLVCKDICIPEFGTYNITFNDGSVGDPVLISQAQEQFPMSLSWPASFEAQGQDIHFEISVPDNVGTSLKSATNITLFPAVSGMVSHAAPQNISFDGNILTVIQQKGEKAVSDIPAAEIVLTYEMGENDTRTKKSVSFIANSKNVQHQNATITSQDADENVTAPNLKLGFFAALIFAFLGGVILNLMPCVFPVLSLKALKLSQLQDKDNAKAKAQGLAYTAGIVSAFLVIASILLLLKAAGAEIGWGFQLQNPIVVGLLTYLLFLIGLNLSGYFEVKGFSLSSGGKLTGNDGLSGSFFTGVLATIVATPCTAPFMGAAMGYALVQPPFVSILVFTVLGLGLAFPYLLLSWVPALRHLMPKPGAWMERFKEVLAFPMFGFAAWLLWVLSAQVDSFGVLVTLLGLVGVTFAIWALKNNFKLLGIVLVFFSLAPLLSLHTAAENRTIPQEIRQGQNWQHFTPDHLETALSNDNPVFVNMTADWCITCKVNERVALNTAQNRMLFQDMKVQYIKGDWTNRDPDITQYLEKYGRAGVPLYVYYGSRDTQTGQRPDPVLLPQILTPGIVKDVLKN